MNLEIEKLIEHVQQVKNGFIKEQNYTVAAALRNMELVLYRLNISGNQNELTSERLEALKNTVKND